MFGKFQEHLQKELADIQAAGLYKNERIITTPQRADIKVKPNDEVLNFCANNYLGLSDNSRLIKAATETMSHHGYGMSSVRFICGTSDIHKELEAAIADYFHTEDAILYGSCFDANGGLFEALLTEEDAIISDSLNHASIIDGVRLCKAKRYRYANADMGELLARVRAMLRRREEFTPTVLRCGDLELNQQTAELRCGENAAVLPKLEYKLMELLMLNRGRCLSTEDMLVKVWGYETEADVGVVWVYLSYLRKRLSALGSRVEIKARRGIGYTLEEPK